MARCKGLRALGREAETGTGPGQDRSQRSAETLPATQPPRRLRKRETQLLPLQRTSLCHAPRLCSRPLTLAPPCFSPRPPGPAPPLTPASSHLLILTMADSAPGQSPPQETSCTPLGNRKWSNKTFTSLVWVSVLQQAAGASAEGHMGHLGALRGWSGALVARACAGGTGLHWVAGPPSSTPDQFQAGPGGPPGHPLQTSPQSVLSLTWALAHTRWVTMSPASQVRGSRQVPDHPDTLRWPGCS